MPAKVAAKVKCLLNREIGKVLAAESDDLALGDEACQFILASIVQLGQLNAANLRPDGGGQVDNGSSLLRKEVRVRGIRIFAVFNVLKRLKWRIFLVGVPSREVVGILVAPLVLYVYRAPTYVRNASPACGLVVVTYVIIPLL